MTDVGHIVEKPIASVCKSALSSVVKLPCKWSCHLSTVDDDPHKKCTNEAILSDGDPSKLKANLAIDLMSWGVHVQSRVGSGQ